MNSIILTQIQKYISESLQSDNIFDNFIERCKWYYESPAHSINEIKLKQNTKIKEDVFEHFCYLYLKHVKKWTVWFLKDLPKNIKKELSLDNQDLGIDLVAWNSKTEKYYAIQAKYRKPNQKSKTVLGWKQLSTFLVLASRTGPWERHIVFTNADYVRHAGKKSSKDWSMCLGTMRGIKRHQWEAMLEYTGRKLSETPKKTSLNKITVKTSSVSTLDELVRKKRLERFEKINMA